MDIVRSAGILLHPNSLPGDFGAGDFGPEAYKFIDWLKEAGQSWWQILPTGPTDHQYSPYCSQSSFAGNTLFIDYHELVQKGDLDSSDIEKAKVKDRSKIDYNFIWKHRNKLLHQAAQNFFGREKNNERDLYEEFCEKEEAWLEDWSLFAALKIHFKNDEWWKWPLPVRSRDPEALEVIKKGLEEEVQIASYCQYRFFEQWDKLYKHARYSGIEIIGDIPIYCSHDSADVWANQGMFKLKKSGEAEYVAGVPPDYFSDTGQNWGTPVYRWSVHQADQFRWWIDRIKGVLRTCDLARIDHFRGLSAYWEIDAECETAVDGKWVDAPGNEFMTAVQEDLKQLPFIAEDLGVITPDVVKLREDWNLPGMRILQFAFWGDTGNCHLGFHHISRSAVYTGTHDNDTTLGWYNGLPDESKDLLKYYLKSDGEKPHLDLIRYAYESVSDLAIIPAQDVVGLGSEARVNTPGTFEGIYRWKLTKDQVCTEHAEMLYKLAERFQRLGRD